MESFLKRTLLLLHWVFDWLGNEGQETLVASDSSMVWLVDLKARELNEQKFPIFNNFKTEMKLIDGLSKIKNNGLYGLVDRSAKVVIDFQYDEIVNEFGFPIAVKQKGKWGYLNQEYLQASAFQYEQALPFIKGYALVKKKEGYTIINKTGVEQLKGVFDELKHLSSSYFMAKKDDKFGVIAVTGNELLPIEYDSISLNNGHLLQVKKTLVLDYFDMKTKKFLFHTIHTLQNQK